MRFSRTLFTVLLLLVTIVLTSKPAFADEYLFDLLIKPEYAKAWNVLIQNEKTVDAWLLSYHFTARASCWYLHHIEDHSL